jgi:toxin YoeB
VRPLWSTKAWEDYEAWIDQDLDIVRKINALIRDVRRDPFRGLGKPEPLRGSLQGWWSRRITGEHRLVYRVAGTGDDKRLEVVQCRYHYAP